MNTSRVGRKDISPTISRRAFLAASGTAGGGLLLTAVIPLGEFPGKSIAAEPLNHQITVYARFARSGAVTILAPNPEMGQGIKTSLPMIFAEELCVAWKDVTIEMADYRGDKSLGGQGSGGSASIGSNWLPLRRAGAAGRQLFVAAAAQTWRASESDCSAEEGRVRHLPSGRTLSYGELSAKASTLPMPDLEKVTLKDESAFTIIGKSVVDPDKARIVVGQQQFGIDIKVPNMKYAVYQKSPVFDAEVVGANIDEVRAMPGVRDAFVLKGAERRLEGPQGQPPPLVDDGLHGGVAIVADTWYQAQTARKKLEVEWTRGAHDDDSSAGFEATARRLLAQPPQNTLRQDGDPERALASASKVLRASYSYPFLAHATMEPQNCVASYVDGKVEIWAPTQNPGPGRQGVAKALGIAPDDITIHLIRCGGGFGRRLCNDYMIEAAVISKRIAQPVKVLWSREDDLQHDFYRPGGYHNFTAGFDSAGKLIAFSNHFAGFARTDHFNMVSAPGGDEFPGGFVSNFAVRTSRIPFNVPVGMLRAPGDNAHGFVYQSFLDELAHAAGRDPIEFQIELLKHPVASSFPVHKQPFAANFIPDRMMAVMERVREMSGWTRRSQLPKGTGLGFACFYSHSGYVAQIHKVRVAPDKTTVPEQVWIALDVGRHVINPTNAENQVQGSILDGLSSALYQQITINRGRVVQSNFNDYRLLRNTQIPAIEIAFIKTDFNPTGLGEPALASSLPAYCNAIFAASGDRVRSLPINMTLKPA
jgi:isoquinoline 1-oxidoreductase beta subunit